MQKKNNGASRVSELNDEAVKRNYSISACASLLSILFDLSVDKYILLWSSVPKSYKTLKI
jgi:hypothetical protein